jgi:hypothetical protein
MIESSTVMQLEGCSDVVVIQFFTFQVHPRCAMDISRLSLVSAVKQDVTPEE